MGPRCSSAETQVCHRSYIIAAKRRATKLVKNIQHLSYTERLKYIGLPSLQYRRLRADMVETFKILNNIDKVQHEHIFPISRTATRGHNQKIYNKNSRTNIRKYSFSQRIVDMWNSLPKQVIETKTVNTFKSQLNNHWKNLEIKFSPDVYRPEEISNLSRRVHGAN